MQQFLAENRMRRVQNLQNENEEQTLQNQNMSAYRISAADGRSFGLRLVQVEMTS
jgi:hypothetical protein